MGAGILIFIAGTRALGKSLTPFPEPLAGTPLIQHGIYGWIRHPLYTSLMLIALGWAFVWQSWPALVATGVLILFFDAKAKREERFLQDKFPGYADYQKRVRRFIPRLY